MATEVKIPTLGESITSGILAKWHVNAGDFVRSGQTIYDLETDKITSEGTAECDGRIELKASEGDEVEIGSVVAIIDESATAPSSSDAATAPAEEPTQKPEPEAPIASQQSAPQTTQDKAAETPFRQPPSVRRLAQEHGIDPASVQGSAKGGRVTKGDMLNAVAKSESAASSDAGHSSIAQPAERSTRSKMTPLRRTIANRLVEAQHTTAMLTTFNEVDMSAVVAARKQHQDAFIKNHGTKLGFMSFFVKSVVHALKTWPAVNAMIDGDEIVTHHYYDIGVAVSTPKGLMVPVVRDCDQLSFAGIEQTIIDCATRAREGKIGIDDLKGGVFTITNGGIFGSMLSTPILNSPQSAILGMHTIQERAVVVNGEIVIRPMMYLALSYDHRIVDGREAVGFLCTVKNCIEDPSRLLFEI